MKTLQEQLKEINNSTLRNMQFLLESYSSEVLEALKSYNTTTEESQSVTLEAIHKEVSSVIHTLRGIETVINHHHLRQKEAS